MAVLYAVVTILLIAADQIVKTWAVVALAGTDGINAVPHVLKFVYVENRGIAFGMFQNLQPVLVPLSIAIMIACIVLAVSCHKKKKTLAVWSLLLVVAGAAGNIIDKVMHGYVVDFICTTFIDFPVFNLADIFICVGAALFAVYILFFDKEEQTK